MLSQEDQNCTLVVRHSKQLMSFLQTFTGVTSIMHECWSNFPNVRVEALRVKKSLMKIIDSYNAQQLTA